MGRSSRYSRGTTTTVSSSILVAVARFVPPSEARVAQRYRLAAWPGRLLHIQVAQLAEIEWRKFLRSRASRFMEPRCPLRRQSEHKTRAYSRRVLAMCGPVLDGTMLAAVRSLRVQRLRPSPSLSYSSASQRPLRRRAPRWSSSRRTTSTCPGSTARAKCASPVMEAVAFPTSRPALRTTGPSSRSRASSCTPSVRTAGGSCRPRQWAIDPSPSLSTEPVNVDLSPNGRIIATQNADLLDVLRRAPSAGFSPDRVRLVHRFLRLPEEPPEGDRARRTASTTTTSPRGVDSKTRSQHQLRDLQRSGLHQPGRQADARRRLLPRPGPRPRDRNQLVRPRRRRDDSCSRQVRGRAPTDPGPSLRRRQRRHHPDLPYGPSHDRLHALSARSAPVAGSARRPTRPGLPTARPSSGGRTAEASTQHP